MIKSRKDRSVELAVEVLRKAHRERVERLAVVLRSQPVPKNEMEMISAIVAFEQRCQDEIPTVQDAAFVLAFCAEDHVGDSHDDLRQLAAERLTQEVAVAGEVRWLLVAMDHPEAPKMAN